MSNAFELTFHKFSTIKKIWKRVKNPSYIWFFNSTISLPHILNYEKIDTYKKLEQQIKTKLELFGYSNYVEDQFPEGIHISVKLLT